MAKTTAAQRKRNKKNWKKNKKNKAFLKKKHTYLREYNKARRTQNQAWLRELKSTKGCATCPENDARCLDFHHLDPKRKSFTIGSSLMENRIKLQAEVEKCIVLCSNCHRKLDPAYGN